MPHLLLNIILLSFFSTLTNIIRSMKIYQFSTVDLNCDINRAALDAAKKREHGKFQVAYRGCRFKSWIFSSFTFFSNMLCAVKFKG